MARKKEAKRIIISRVSVEDAFVLFSDQFKEEPRSVITMVVAKTVQHRGRVGTVVETIFVAWSAGEEVGIPRPGDLILHVKDIDPRYRLPYPHELSYPRGEIVIPLQRTV